MKYCPSSLFINVFFIYDGKSYLLDREQKDKTLFLFVSRINKNTGEFLIFVLEFGDAAYFVAGTDIGKFTIKTLDDIRTLNKSVHFRPTCNLYNMNELASLWEKKIGKTLPRVTVTENDLLAAAAGPFFSLILSHSRIL